jgi:putative effector of murein hydrolase
MRERKAPLLWRLKHWSNPRNIRGLISKRIAYIVPKITDGEVVTMMGEIKAKHISKFDNTIYNYGTLSNRAVTNDFAALLVDHLHGGDTMEPATFVYHAAGTSGTAESSGDTALGAEVLRSTGSSTETSAQVYKSVATLTFASSGTMQEHGLLDGDTSAARVLMDRSVYTGIAVNASDQIEFTYELTVVSGG